MGQVDCPSCLTPIPTIGVLARQMGEGHNGDKGGSIGITPTHRHWLKKRRGRLATSSLLVGRKEGGPQLPPSRVRAIASARRPQTRFFFFFFVRWVDRG